MKLTIENINILYSLSVVNTDIKMLPAREEMEELYVYGLANRQTNSGVRTVSISKAGIKLVEMIETIKHAIKTKETA